MLSVGPLNADDLNADIPDPGIIINGICARDVDGCIICESVNPNNIFLFILRYEALFTLM